MVKENKQLILSEKKKSQLNKLFSNEGLLNIDELIEFGLTTKDLTQYIKILNDKLTCLKNVKQ